MSLAQILQESRVSFLVLDGGQLNRSLIPPRGIPVLNRRIASDCGARLEEEGNPQAPLRRSLRRGTLISFSAFLFHALSVCIILLMFTANQDRELNKCHLRELGLFIASFRII